MLGRSLDELPPQTRKLVLLIDEMVRGECGRLQMERADFRFSRRDVRAYTGWGDTQLKVHLHRLEELEYLLAHRGGRGQSFVYELLFESKGDDSKPMLPGLIDVARLTYDEKKAGLEEEKSAPGRGHVGGMSANGRRYAVRINVYGRGSALCRGGGVKALLQAASVRQLTVCMRCWIRYLAWMGAQNFSEDTVVTRRVDHRLLPRLVPRARARRRRRDHAAGAGTLSAVALSVPQEERRAADLPHAEQPAAFAEELVPVAGAAELSAAQSGFGADTAAAGEPACRNTSSTWKKPRRFSRSPTSRRSKACAIAPSSKRFTRPGCGAWKSRT